MSPRSALFAVAFLFVPFASAHATGITNGDFSAGLTGWNTVGPVTDGGGYALIDEDPVFIRTTLEQAFVIPDHATTLSFDHTMSASPDGTSGGVFSDYFLASLLDPVTLDPILSTPGFTDYFFRNNLGMLDYDASIVTLSGNTVTLNLAGVSGGTDALLAFDLLGDDDGLHTQVAVDNCEVEVSAPAIPEPITAVGLPLGLLGLAAYLRRGRRK